MTPAPPEDTDRSLITREKVLADPDEGKEKAMELDEFKSSKSSKREFEIIIEEEISYKAKRKVTYREAL